MTQTLAELLNVTNAVVDATLKTANARAAPKKHSACARACMCAAGVPLCGVCFAWSAIWRVACCPWQCLVRGPGFSLSNNHCTNLTDSCIAQYADAINADATIGTLNAALARPSTQETRDAFVQALSSLKQKFQDEAKTIAHYVLCDRVLAPLTDAAAVLPANAVEYIDVMIKRLEEAQ